MSSTDVSIWSSKFPHDNRLGIFPSGSVAWRVSEEKFFEPLRSWMDNLKLRLSFGTLGNQNVGEYDYIAKMKVSQGNYIVNGANLSYLSTPDAISSNFTWEKSKPLMPVLTCPSSTAVFRLRSTGISVTHAIC